MSAPPTPVNPAPEPTALRRLTPEDRDPALALMRATLGEGPMGRTAEVWRWKHETSPFGPSVGLLAEPRHRQGNHENVLAGLRLFLRWRFRAAGHDIDAVRAVDTATHPEWRGQGIFKRLTLQLLGEMREENAALVFNTPNGQSRPGYLKMGWTSVTRLPLWIRPAWRRIAGRTFLRRPRPEISMQPSFGRPVEELLATPNLAPWLERIHAGEPRLHTPRSPELLRWRYTEIPALSYRAMWSFGADPSSDGGAAIIARARHRGPLHELSLAEILVTPDAAGRDHARHLLHRLLNESGADHLLALAARRTAERRVLVSAGFLPIHVPSRHFTVHPLHRLPGELDPTDWSAWRLQLGDLELF